MAWIAPAFTRTVTSRLASSAPNRLLTPTHSIANPGSLMRHHDLPGHDRAPQPFHLGVDLLADPGAVVVVVHVPHAPLGQPEFPDSPLDPPLGHGADGVVHGHVHPFDH